MLRTRLLVSLLVLCAVLALSGHVQAATPTLAAATVAVAAAAAPATATAATTTTLAAQTTTTTTTTTTKTAVATAPTVTATTTVAPTVAAPTVAATKPTVVVAAAAPAVAPTATVAAVVKPITAALRAKAAALMSSVIRPAAHTSGGTILSSPTPAVAVKRTPDSPEQIAIKQAQRELKRAKIAEALASDKAKTLAAEMVAKKKLQAETVIMPSLAGLTNTEKKLVTAQELSKLATAAALKAPTHAKDHADIAAISAVSGQRVAANAKRLTQLVHDAAAQAKITEASYNQKLAQIKSRLILAQQSKADSLSQLAKIKMQRLAAKAAAAKVAPVASSPIVPAASSTAAPALTKLVELATAIFSSPLGRAKREAAKTNGGATSSSSASSVPPLTLWQSLLIAVGCLVFVACMVALYWVAVKPAAAEGDEAKAAEDKQAYAALPSEAPVVAAAAQVEAQA